MENAINEQRTNNTTKTIKKAFFYFIGMFFIAFGINISKTAGLGISPVSAVPYACELIWGFKLSISTAFVYMGLILIEIIILRNRFKPIQLLQFFITYVLSFFIEYTSREYVLLSWLPDPSNYAIAFAYLLISIVIIGFGVSLYLIPRWIPLPAEGLATAVAEVSNGKISFPNAKSSVDSSLVIISAILSLVFLGGLFSVREGTVLAAIFVGKVVGICNKAFKQKILDWIG